MIRIFTLFAAFGIAFATPAFADPASDALAGEQAAEAAPAVEAPAEDAAAPAGDDKPAEERFAAVLALAICTLGVVLEHPFKRF